MNFRVLMMLLEGLRDDFIVKEYDLGGLEVEITKSSGQVFLMVLDEKHEVIANLKWDV